MLCELCGNLILLDIFVPQISHKKSICYTEFGGLFAICVKSALFFLCEICAKPDFGKMSSSVGKSIYLYVVKKLKNYFFRAARIRKNASVAKKSTPRK